MNIMILMPDFAKPPLDILCGDPKTEIFHRRTTRRAWVARHECMYVYIYYYHYYYIYILLYIYCTWLWYFNVFHTIYNSPCFIDFLFYRSHAGDSQLHVPLGLRAESTAYFFSGSFAERKMDTYLEYMFFNIPILVHLLMKHITVWWFGTWVDYDFPFSWECHHPNWRVVIFFRAVETTNQLWCKPILTSRQTTTKSPPRANPTFRVSEIL